MLFLQKSISEEKKKYKFCSNRSNLNGLRKIKLPNKSIALAELIGICLGDGYISKYQVAITLNAVADNDYIPYVAALINTLFPEVTISYVIRKNDNAIDVRINSKIVADFLYNM